MTLFETVAQVDPTLLQANVWFVGHRTADQQRKGRYAPESSVHPAKMYPELARRLIAAYSQPEDWVFDPMAGIGTTLVEAVHLGRNACGMEIEERYFHIMAQNLEIAKRGGATGHFHIHLGDARRISGELVLPPGTGHRVNGIIFSPPYGAAQSGGGIAVQGYRGAQGEDAGLAQRVYSPIAHSENPENIGNLDGPLYERAMVSVYQGCYKVLEPGKFCCVVVRDQIRQGQVVPLAWLNLALAQQAGFQLFDRIIAVLGTAEMDLRWGPRVVSRASFWRRLQTEKAQGRGDPRTLWTFEDVLVLQKPMKGA